MPEFIIPLRSLRDKSPYTTEILCLEKTDTGTIVPMGLVKGLSLIGEPAVETLIEALKDKNSGIRRAATIALGEIGDARAVEPSGRGFK